MNHPFLIKQVASDIYCITEPWFKEHANCYLFKGTSFDLLVDCGMGVFDMKAFLEVRGFHPRVVVTHSHFDHAGGLRHFSPSNMMIPELIAYNLRSRSLWGLEYLKPEDFDAQQLSMYATESPTSICSRYTMASQTIQPYRQANISIGKYVFDIIQLPGHMDDSVALYDKREKLLISGDMLYNGTIYAALPNSNREQFQESLRSIQSLDLRLVLPGHNEILTGVQASKVIDQWLNQLRLDIKNHNQ